MFGPFLYFFWWLTDLFVNKFMNWSTELFLILIIFEVHIMIEHV